MARRRRLVMSWGLVPGFSVGSGCCSNLHRGMCKEHDRRVDAFVTRSIRANGGSPRGLHRWRPEGSFQSDAIYLKARQGGQTVSVEVTFARGVNADSRREALGLVIGASGACAAEHSPSDRSLILLTRLNRIPA